jgi:hypothetical protein
MEQDQHHHHSFGGVHAFASLDATVEIAAEATRPLPPFPELCEKCAGAARGASRAAPVGFSA